MMQTGNSRALIKRLVRPARPVAMWFGKHLRRVNPEAERRHPIAAGNITGIRAATLEYIDSMKVRTPAGVLGYRYSRSTTHPLLYCTLAALLVKHLYGAKDESTEEELERVVAYQSEDGLFRDPVIACGAAEVEDWWGWRHLTLHALMTLAIYGVPARAPLRYLEQFGDHEAFRRYLLGRDWGERAAFTSNELQNVGVMLQYARDYQHSLSAGSLLETLYEVIQAKQDPVTGLYGERFDTAERLSSGVQAGYHFWLLLFYDAKPVARTKAIIDNVLRTQNPLGGYGVPWNSSACEDIDSIDPLVRLSCLTDYRLADVKASLHRALGEILSNLNEDGGWVFRRHEALELFHPEMASGRNVSNVFYTWFRTLGLAYCLLGLRDECPATMRFGWNLTHNPGLQLALPPRHLAAGQV